MPILDIRRDIPQRYVRGGAYSVSSARAMSTGKAALSLGTAQGKACNYVYFKIDPREDTSPFLYSVWAKIFHETL